jgi:hypothetical protein
MSLTNRDPDSASSGVSMDLMSIVSLMWRHWRVTGPALVATIGLVVAAWMMGSPSYSASASLALFSTPPAPLGADGTPVPIAGNPFDRYGDLSVVADIVARKMDSESVRAELTEQGVTGYEVVANRLSRGPLVEVTGTGPNAKAAINAANAVVAEFDVVLRDMQVAEGADALYVITSGPVESPETAEAQVGSTLRTVIGVVAIGGLATLSLAVVAETISRRRTAKRQHAASTPSQSGGGQVANVQGPDPAHVPGRPPSSPGRLSTVYRPAEDRPPRSSGGGSRTAREPGDPGAGPRAETPNGSRRREWIASSVPGPDRAEGQQADGGRWPSSSPPSPPSSPSNGTFAPENGHKKPTTDRRP